MTQELALKLIQQYMEGWKQNDLTRLTTNSPSEQTIVLINGLY